MVDYVRPESNAASVKSFSYQNFIVVTQQTVSVVISLGVLFTASGFIIVNSYLAKFTDIFAYFVIPSRYLTAGIGLWLVWMVCIIIAGPIIYRYARRQQHVEKQMDMLTSAQNKTHSLTRLLNFAILSHFSEELYRYLRLQKRSLLAGMLIYLFIGGFIYGYVVYEKIPRFLGGGTNPEVSLVLKPDISTAYIGIASVPGYPERTQPLKLIAELNNGLLLQDITTGVIFSVHNENIIAIIDIHS